MTASNTLSNDPAKDRPAENASAFLGAGDQLVVPARLETLNGEKAAVIGGDFYFGGRAVGGVFEVEHLDGGASRPLVEAV